MSAADMPMWYHSHRTCQLVSDQFSYNFLRRGGAYFEAAATTSDVSFRHRIQQAQWRQQTILSGARTASAMHSGRHRRHFCDDDCVWSTCVCACVRTCTNNRCRFETETRPGRCDDNDHPKTAEHDTVIAAYINAKGRRNSHTAGRSFCLQS